MRFLPWLLLALVSTAGARSFTKGQSLFRVEADDSLSIIKDRLVYLATRDIISQELQSMGFDSTLFWRRYELALKEKLDPIKQSLQKAYGSKQSIYQKAWRAKRFKEEKNFVNLLKMLDSYKVARVRPSSRDPNVRYLKMEGKVNRSRLKRMYFRFVKNVENRIIDNIYWTFDLSLSQGDWRQLGVAKKEDIIAPLNESFLDKLEKVFGRVDQNIIITDPINFERIQNHLRLSESELGDLRNTETQMDALINSVWIHVKFNVALLTKIEELGRKTMESYGDFIVTELRYNRPIYLSKIKLKKSRIPSLDGQHLTNKVASRIFQRIVPEFVPAKGELAKLAKDINRTPLRIVGHQNYIELQQVRNLLAQMGEKYRLKTHLDYFSLKEAQIILEYMGSPDDLRKILAFVPRRNLKNGKMVSINSKSDPIELRVDSR